MSKKFLLPLLALVLIPVVLLDVEKPDADALGKNIAKKWPNSTMGIHVTEEAITEAEEVQRASLVIEGTVLNAQPYWQTTNDPDYPEIFTDYTISVDNAIKGTSKQTITVTLLGGFLDGITAKSPSPILAEGDRVIMVLGQDLRSLFHESYTPVSISKSIYLIDKNDYANNENYPDRSGDREHVQSRLAKLANR